MEEENTRNTNTFLLFKRVNSILFYPKICMLINDNFFFIMKTYKTKFFCEWLYVLYNIILLYYLETDKWPS